MEIISKLCSLYAKLVVSGLEGSLQMRSLNFHRTSLRSCTVKCYPLGTKWEFLYLQMLVLAFVHSIELKMIYSCAKLRKDLKLFGRIQVLSIRCNRAGESYGNMVE